MSFTAMAVGNRVTFQVYPSAIIGNSFKNVKVVGLVTMQATRGIIDAVALHTNVYPSLPGGSPNDPASYQYYLIEYPDGTIGAVGKPWIIEGTISQVVRSTLQFTLVDIDPDDQPTVIQALAANGFTAVDVKVLS